MFWTRLQSILRYLTRRSRVEQDLDEEIRSYVEQAVRDQIERGARPDDARRQVLLQFGGTEQVKEITRESRSGAWLDTGLRDVRHAFRVLRRNPSFTLLAVLTTALGIGAAAATFSVVDTVLLRPLPYKEADRLVQIWPTAPAFRNEPAFQSVWDQWWLEYPAYLGFRARQSSFEDIAAFSTGPATLVEPDESRRITIGKADTNFFDLIGLPALRGRLILKNDESAGAPRVAVLSHEAWLNEFGGDPGVVGRTAIVEELSAAAYTVIGVLPQDFQINPQRVDSKRAPDLWVPFGRIGPSDNDDIEMLGRLKPGITLASAQKETAAIFAELPPDPTTPFQIPLGARLVLRQEQEAGSAKTPLLLVFGASGLLLLIACGNVANLVLDRAVARRHEIALRAALGASRMRIVRQLITESLVLSLAGGCAGMVLASWFIRGLIRLAPAGLPHINDAGLDLRVLLFMGACSIVTGIGFGVTPALSLLWRDLNPGLQASSRHRGSPRGRVQGFVIVAEIAVSFVLLVTAGLVTQSLFRLTRTDTGLRPDRLLTVRLVLPHSGYPDEGRISSFYRMILPRLRSLPGVQAISGISMAPFSERHRVLAATDLAPEGVQMPAGKFPASLENRSVLANYFEVAGTAMVEGRSFTEADIAGNRQVVIVNQAMARLFWPGQSAIDKRAGSHGTVIGVSADSREFKLGEEVKPMLYFPARTDLNDMTLLVRTARDPAQLGAAVRREIRAVDKSLPIEQMETMETLIAATYSSERYRTILIGVFALAAIFLALIGLYGVISRSVAQRTRELGIRIAIGATPGRVLWFVLQESLWLTAAGVAIGLIGAVAATRLVAGLLFGIGATDPSTYIGIALGLVLVALFASYVPARRAARIDPAECLRAD